MVALAHPNTAQIAAAETGHETSRPVLPEKNFRQMVVDIGMPSALCLQRNRRDPGARSIHKPFRCRS